MLSEKDISQVIERIKTVNNKQVIDEVNRLLDFDFDDTPFQTEQHHKLTIDQAQKEIHQKKGIPSEKADQEIDQWLRK